MSENHQKKVKRVTWAGFFASLLLGSLKCWAGYVGKSKAVLADGIHSFSDCASDLAVLYGFQVANKPADYNHSYGHGKYETIATVFIGLLLLFVAFGISATSINRIFEYVFLNVPLQKPDTITIYAAFVSIIVKESLFWITWLVSQQIDNQLLRVNAWHHRSDALSSLGTLIGTTCAAFLGPNWGIMDPLAAIVVSLLILKIALPIILEGVQELSEASLSGHINQQILDLAQSVEGVDVAQNLKTRKIGSQIAIDIHIKVDKTLNIIEAHNIASRVELVLQNKFGEKTFISVHVEPLL